MLSTPALAVLLFVAPPQQKQAEPASPPIARPAYRGLPQDRDWSVLRGDDGEPAADWLDPIKFVPLNDSGSNWISFGGQLRGRVESWEGFNFGGAPPGVKTSDTFVLTRALFHVDLHLGTWFRAFTELKGAWVDGRELVGGGRPIDRDDAALQQLFVDGTLDMGESSLTLRPGRQAYSFGKQRLVSRLPWGNTLRTWDGVTAIWQQAGWKATGFWSQFVPVNQGGFNEPDPDNVLFGLYAEDKAPGRSRQHDLYLLGIDRATATFNGTTGAERRLTVGGRISDKSATSGLGGELEAGYQFGTLGPGDISAWFLAALGDYSFDLGGLKSRAFVGYDYASGDDSPGGGVGTFNQLFPLGHAYLGYIDIIGRQNIVDYHAGLGTTVAPRATVTAAYHVFQLADSNDALYNAGGGVVVPGGASGSRAVGSEVDLRLTWGVTRHLSCLLGYSHFFAGAVQRDAGLTEDTDFLYLQLQYDF